MFARRGEVQAARAAQAAGIPFCLSTVGVCPIAEVKAGAPGEIWFQLYMIRDRAFMVTLLDQATAAGCTKLLFTVDLPMLGARYRDYHSGLVGAPGARGDLRRLGQAPAASALDVGCRHARQAAHARQHLAGAGRQSRPQGFLPLERRQSRSRITWRDIDWIRQRWKGQLILKGILDAEDAVAAADAGADGIVVSNHGGRQLDGVISAARALPAIAEAVGDRLTVLADGGIRSGLDVVRMLALGARGVLLGRAWAFALAGNGGAGVAHMLALLRAEMSIAMALTGCVKIQDISRNSLQPLDGNP
ncbi:MAG: L-lactate dehydrogenase [Rhodospirillales bacterium]